MCADIGLSQCGVIGDIHGAPSGRSLLLDAYPQDVADGVSLLSLPATINGQTVLPEFVYRASGLAPDMSTLAPTTYGGTLALAGVGADPTLCRGPFLSGDNAICTTAGKYYQAPNTTLGNVGTDDMIIEVVLRIAETTANKAVVRKRNGPGWYLLHTSSSSFTFYIQDAVANTYRVIASAQPPGYYRVLCVLDRDYASGMYGFVNGIKSGATDPTGVQLAIDSSSSLTVSEHPGTLLSLTMWHAPSWLRGDATGDAEILAWDRERYYTLLGAIPKGRLYSHVTHTRTTAALTEVDGRFYTVGANWPRAGRREGHVGFMPGRVMTNVLNGHTYSADFTKWTKGEAADAVALGAVEGLVDSAPWSELKCSADVSDNHHLLDTLSPATAYENGEWLLLKKGTARWCYIASDPAATGALTDYAYFDLQNAVAGSKTAGSEHYITPQMDGATVLGYQVWFRWPGAVGAAPVAIGVCDADGDPEYSGGDGSAVDLYLCHAQHEYEAGSPGDLWTTTGSAGSPAADSYYIDVTGLLGATGRIETRHLSLPSAQHFTAGTVASLNKAGSAADSIQHCSANLTTQQPETILTATGGTARTVSPAVDIYDDTGVVIARSTWKAGRAAAEAAGVGAIITTPVAADIPAGLTRLAIGHTSGLRLPGGLIGSVKLFDK